MSDSKSGLYRFIDGKWLKVSDRPARTVDAYVPQGGYVDEHLCSHIESHDDGVPAAHVPTRIETKEQKARLLRERGLVEDGGWTKPARRKYFSTRFKGAS